MLSGRQSQSRARLLICWLALKARSSTIQRTEIAMTVALLCGGGGTDSVACQWLATMPRYRRPISCPPRSISRSGGRFSWRLVGDHVQATTAGAHPVCYWSVKSLDRSRIHRLVCGKTAERRDTVSAYWHTITARASEQHHSYQNIDLLSSQSTGL